MPRSATENPQRDHYLRQHLSRQTALIAPSRFAADSSGPAAIPSVCVGTSYCRIAITHRCPNVRRSPSLQNMDGVAGGDRRVADRPSDGENMQAVASTDHFIAVVERLPLSLARNKQGVTSMPCIGGRQGRLLLVKTDILL